MQKNNSNKGFIGLLALLITVSIIIFFIVRPDLFTLEPKWGSGLQNNAELEGNNILEKGFNAIDKAKDAKALMEKNNQQSVAE